MQIIDSHMLSIMTIKRVRFHNFQNRKIVGAVTRVLVNSPDTGYGSFTENMPNTAE
ncbi:MAG: hypothetical protein J6C98_06040 [Oscillospiraceae bacterium]|nr:hypothetical protein [Oscillospiraceae bacterium]